MLVAETVVGRLDDESVAARLEGAERLTVTVDDTERRRSRFRTTAEDGTEVGVVVGRDLRDGDVLAGETDDGDDVLVVVSLEQTAAMVVDLAGVDDAGAATAALALGHAVGNRHWDLAVEGDRAYLPVTEDRDRMETTVDPHLPAGATVAYEAVPPTLFDDDTAHSHGGHPHDEGDAHSHAHGADPDDGHTHARAHTHGHDHGHDDGGHAGRTLDPEDGGDGS